MFAPRARRRLFVAAPTAVCRQRCTCSKRAVPDKVSQHLRGQPSNRRFRAYGCRRRCEPLACYNRELTHCRTSRRLDVLGPLGIDASRNRMNTPTLDPYGNPIAQPCQRPNGGHISKTALAAWCGGVRVRQDDDDHAMHRSARMVDGTLHHSLAPWSQINRE